MMILAVSAIDGARMRRLFGRKECLNVGPFLRLSRSTLERLKIRAFTYAREGGVLQHQRISGGLNI
jgi:hypothetical protein